MEIPAGDAFHESFLLFAIREFQIGREISRYGKCLRFGARLERVRRLPWYVARDPKRACVGRLRSAIRAEEALGHVPPALRKLRRTKGHIYIVGIIEDNVVVAGDVAIVRRSADTSSRRGSFQRVV